MKNKYVIGVDFGTQSARVLLVDVRNGIEVASAEKKYLHGVMSDYLPDRKTELKPDWALQDPHDYIDVLLETIPYVMKKGNIKKDDIIGVGIDFTACTILPIDINGTPLCFYDEFKSNPHSYVKLWKHHSAQYEADYINKVAQDRNEEFLKRYGGKISAEWLIPKVWQVMREAPEVYTKAYKFIEAADWIVLLLTGNEMRNSCTAGYKAMWNKKTGYPSKEFFKAVDSRLENIVDEKLSTAVYPIGTKAGEITDRSAEITGLNPGTAVAVGNLDAHVAVPAVGINESGKMLLIMGTSLCHMILSKEEKRVSGVSGIVEDGILPGYYGYEAGQPCVGDLLEWFVENCVPGEYIKEAERKKINIHQLLTEKAKNIEPGESGLLALDWWNGNRSVLMDLDLTGLILGYTISTKPEEIYRALIEATAFGTRMIIETFEKSGVKVDELYAAGGIAEKNELVMQVYSDITGRQIKISSSLQIPALGSSMFGAVAAGSKNGGYDSIFEASEHMSRVITKCYMPIDKNVEIYNKIYKDYKILHDYFGKGANEVMKRLKKLRSETIIK